MGAVFEAAKETVNLYISLQRPFGGIYSNSADPDQTSQNAVSDLEFHCLLTECSINAKSGTYNLQQTTI